MTENLTQRRPHVRALGALAAQTARQRLTPAGAVDRSDVAALVTLDACRLALCHPEYVAALVADHDAQLRSERGDTFADAVIAAHVAQVDAVVRRFPLPLPEPAPRPAAPPASDPQQRDAPDEPEGDAATPAIGGRRVSRACVSDRWTRWAAPICSGC